MPSESAHLAQYQRNVSLSRRLESLGEFDWAVITMFYAALHLTDAYLARANIHPPKHARRRKIIANHPALSAIWADYDGLEQESQNARYECIQVTAADVQHLRTRRFAPLEQQLRGWLGI